MYKGGNLNTQSSDTPFGNADSGLTSSDMTYSAGHVPHALASTKTCYRVAVCIYNTNMWQIFIVNRATAKDESLVETLEPKNA